MEQEIIKKTQEHDKQFVLINEKLDKHDKRFDQIDERQDLMAMTLAKQGERLDSIDEKLEQVATKEDISRVINTLDEMVGHYRKKDQESTLAAHDFKRVEDKVEEHDADIKEMKKVLEMV